MSRVSFGSRAGTDFDGQQNPQGVSIRRGLPRGPCSTLEELKSALKDEIDAGRESLVPECTTSELSLDINAIIPLHRPGIGPYAEGGTQDLPEEFKRSWAEYEEGDPLESGSTRLSQPQATVDAIISILDSRIQQIVQRAASRGIVAAIEGMDGFKYSFNNAWGAKDEDGQRFSYICQDSMQNKDRHANGFPRTQKHLKPDGERGPRKPTYDCKGSVSVKCSYHRRCIDVYYRHYAIHPIASERKSLPRSVFPRQPSLDTAGGPVQPPNRIVDDGGLAGRLQADDNTNRAASSNVGGSLKRKRDTDKPQLSRDPGKPLSLVELLKQSEASISPTEPSTITPKPVPGGHPPPVAYDLPSWQIPPPSPVRINPQHPVSQAGMRLPYPPPYQPNHQSNYQPQPHQPSQQPNRQPSYQPPPPQPSHQPGRPPTAPAPRPQNLPAQQAYLGPAKLAQPQAQGLFSTLKPVAQDPPIDGFVPYYSPRTRTSCTNCRHAKRKCDEVRPICTGCARAGRHDCLYDLNFTVPLHAWPGATNSGSMGMLPSPQETMRTESPDPWFPKR